MLHFLTHPYSAISLQCALFVGGSTLRTTGAKTEEVKPTSTAGETAAKPVEPMQTSTDDCKPLVSCRQLHFLLPHPPPKPGCTYTAFS